MHQVTYDYNNMHDQVPNNAPFRREKTATKEGTNALGQQAPAKNNWENPRSRLLFVCF